MGDREVDEHALLCGGSAAFAHTSGP